MKPALNDGQLVMTRQGDIGSISHRGTTQTYITYWVMFDSGNVGAVHEDNIVPITRPIYDIARECV